MTAADKRRVRFLEEMGITPTWRLRETAAAASAELPPAALAPAAFGVTESAESSPAPLSASAPPQPVANRSSQPTAAEIALMDWTQLEAAVASCTKCGLCRGRTQTVFGVGDRRARWLFVGEGPGRNEDLRGEPFVGPAGKLLDNMLLSMELKRGENAFIANIVKCRPTDENGRDRPPSAEESATCMPYLERQIALIQPSIIVALGKTAALSLLGADPETPVSKLRGSVHQHGQLPLVVTYHPAYLLRKPEDKAKAWRDLCLAMMSFADVRNAG